LNSLAPTGVRSDPVNFPKSEKRGEKRHRPGAPAQRGTAAREMTTLGGNSEGMLKKNCSEHGRGIERKKGKKIVRKNTGRCREASQGRTRVEKLSWSRIKVGVYTGSKS